MKKMLFAVLIIVPVMFLINSCGNSGIADPEPETLIDNYPWQTGTYQELGLQESMVNEGFAEAQASGIINGIVLVRNGKIAGERYYKNTTASTVFDIKSATKSFVSALIGNAIKRNYITLDTKLVDALPDYKSAVTDTRTNSITVRHLLTMTSGIKSDDDLNLYDSPNSDWVALILGKQLDYSPGTVFRYSDAGVHLLSVIIQKTSNQSTINFANSTIFSHLNITLHTWLTDPIGVPFGGSDMYLTVKAMATLGVLYLNNGVYNYRPVVPEEWVTSSLTNYFGNQMGSVGKMINRGYGYLWWLGEISGHRVFAAMGYGGQLIVCVPDLSMVVASSAPSDVNTSQANTQTEKIIQIIADYFIPAAM